MTHQEIIKILGPVFGETQVMEAVCCLIDEETASNKDELRKTGTDLFHDLDRFLKANGAVKALERVRYRFLRVMGEYEQTYKRLSTEQQPATAGSVE